MDSLTQIALGAGVAHVALGRHGGRRAMVYGGICGTLPDLDVLWPFADPVAAFTWHRGYSHSLFVLSLAAPIIVWLIRRFDRSVTGPPARWFLAIWLTLVTHPILDAITVYGTQLLLPFSDHPFSGSAVFIIDPLVTIPLVAGLIVAWRRDDPASWRRPVGVGLGLAVAYLALTFGAKWQVERHLGAEFAARGERPLAVLTTPAPFTSLWWRVVAMYPDRYEVGYRRVLDGAQTRFSAYPSGHALLEPLAEDHNVGRLQWFTHGFYRARDVDGRIVVTDLRMGFEGAYIFSFVVAERRGAGPVVAVAPSQLEPPTGAPGLIDRLSEAYGGGSGPAANTVQ